MDEKDIKNFEKILEHAYNIQKFSKDVNSCKDFTNNDLINSACLFELLQIGELANNLSKQCVLETSEISWHEIYSMRNRIVHGYAGIDYKIIYKSIKKDIPTLIKVLKKHING